MTAPVYRRRPGIHERVIDDEIFLADPDTDTLFHLNPTGAALWRLLAESATATECVELMAAAFPDVDEQTIVADVAALLDRFADAGLVTSEPPSPG